MRKYGIIGAVGAFIVLADQFTKYLVLEKIPLWHGFPVIDGFFNLVHVRNRGAAFGFLNRSDIEWQFWFFTAMTVVAVAVLLYLAKSARERSYGTLASLGLILGGAVGNFIDRCRFRHVIDFLDFHIGDRHWPAFNVADMGITCGVVLLLLLMFRQWRLEKVSR